MLLRRGSAWSVGSTSCFVARSYGTGMFKVGAEGTEGAIGMCCLEGCGEGRTMGA